MSTSTIETQKEQNWASLRCQINFVPVSRSYQNRCTGDFFFFRLLFLGKLKLLKPAMIAINSLQEQFVSIELLIRRFLEGHARRRRGRADE